MDEPAVGGYMQDHTGNSAPTAPSASVGILVPGQGRAV